MPVHRLQAGSSYLGAMFLAIDISRFFENGMPENAEYKPSVLFATSSEGELIYGDGKLYDAVLEAGENSESFSLKAGSATYAANHYSLSHLGYDLYVLVDKSQYSARTLQLAGRQLLWTVSYTHLNLTPGHLPVCTYPDPGPAGKVCAKVVEK